MSYSVSARGYLQRARSALMSSSNESLFYAAFELRCCIETRQQDYAEALSNIKGSTIKPWKIAETGKRIRKISYADSISLMRFKFDVAEVDVYHTPVTDWLIRFADRGIGELLHAQSKFRSNDDKWWSATREKLIDGYRQAWLACQGAAMVPPLMSQRTGLTHPLVIEQAIHNEKLIKFMTETTGEKFSVGIFYPEAAPENWVCDL
jgi:hypothetical protein